MPFLYPSLLFGLALVAVPVLIHLINMLRQRRIRWAAMEFLLQSQKKNRTWVLLKQLLLLLLRMTAVAAVVLMVAQPVLREKWSTIFGGSRTHHLVLLDDSFSMSDRWGDTSAFKRAQAVIERIGQQAADQPTTQSFELLRFSQIGREGHAPQWDVPKQTVDSDFMKMLGDTLQGLRPSHLAVGPEEALNTIVKSSPPVEGESRVVYIVSDFRAREWNEPGPLVKSLQQLDQAGSQLHLVQCVDETRPNLAVTALRPVGSTRAVGVPLQIDVTVKNFGDAPAKNVAVNVEEDGAPRPAVTFEELPPGESTTKRFQVNFLTAGVHRLTAQLPDDAVAADNLRHCVLDLPLGIPVLIVDGDPNAARNKLSDGRFLKAALAPAGPTPTGLKPQIEGPRFLAQQPLDGFASIYLCNLARLDAAEVEALEAYARRGGGVVFFLGEQSRADFFNSALYRDGKGIFPAPLVAATELLADRAEKLPDLQATGHPAFAVYTAKRNALASSVNIKRYFAVNRDWKPSAESKVKIIASLRNRAPLAIEQPFGDGRVIALLTTAGPRWNNWGQGNPTFVVTMQALQSYLASGRLRDNERDAGTPLILSLAEAEYTDKINITPPEPEAAAPPSDSEAANTDSPPNAANSEPIAAAPPPASKGVDLVAEAAGGVRTARFDATQRPGVYVAKLLKTDEQSEIQAFAVNVDAAEGDLHALDGVALATRLQGVEYKFHRAEDLSYDGRAAGGFNISRLLLYALIGLLLVEQVVAYAVSYHPPVRGAAVA